MANQVDEVIVDDDGREDRISNLPDPVLCHILSFLSTEESVSTSILSKRWRYLFASVSKFYLHDEFLEFLQEPDRSRAFSNFLNFVDRLLILHTSTIEKLILEIGADSSHIYNWILVAITMRGLRKLDLDLTSCFNTFYPQQSSQLLPDVLFTCKTLEFLGLDMTDVLYVPSDVCFPNLKTLHLGHLTFLNDDSVQRLFSSCPMLEVLYIYNCNGKNLSELNISNPSVKRLILENWEEGICRLVIHVPSLVYFSYCDFIKEDLSILADMHSLVEADIEILFDTTCYYDLPIHAVHDQLLQAVGHVKILHLHFDISRLPGFSHERFLPIFINLVELEISDKYWTCPGMGLFTFLKTAPNLETLRLIHNFQEYENSNRYRPRKVPSCLLFRLKEIKITNASRDKILFEMVTWLLKNAVVLEKLTVVCRLYLKEKEKSEITRKILTLPRSSEKCQVLIL